MNPNPRLVIAGAGFAGLKLARGLKNSGFDILLIDKLNHHQFQPLFYQVATAHLEPSNISFPLRGILHGTKKVKVRLAEVTRINPSENKVVTDCCEYDYDYLVLAMGATTNFFGNKNLEQFAMPMKSTSEAIAIRQRILLHLERALIVTDEDEITGLLNIVIVGGGPTGVELAGAFAETRKNALWKDYPEMDFSGMHIILIESGPKIMGMMSEEASQKSKEYLEKLGVEVWLNTVVKDYDGKVVMLSNGKTVRSDNVIWAAGVTGNIIEGLDPQLIQKGNRIKVDRFNRIPGSENIFAIGDIAYMETPKYPKGHPQVANVALSQGGMLIKNLKALLLKKPMEEYEYHDKGSMATIGKHKAVVDLPFIKFQGVFAWYVWMGVHLMLLMGMKNKIFVFIDWIIAYFSNNSTLRLIFRPWATRKEQ